MNYRTLLPLLAAAVLMTGARSANAAAENAADPSVESQCGQVGVAVPKPEPERSLSSEDLRKSEMDRQAKRKAELCADAKHGTPLFSRPDLAYSVTGIDCFGDAPSGYSTDNGQAPAEANVYQSERDRAPASLREPASTKEHGVYHPVQ